MDYEEIIEELDSREFLDKLYGFAYKRCSDSHTAEDLCSEIIIKVLSSAGRNPHIEHIHAYIWTVAHRVYADFCEKRRLDSQRLAIVPLSENTAEAQTNPIEDMDSVHTRGLSFYY